MAAVRWSIEARADLRALRAFNDRLSHEFSASLSRRITAGVNRLRDYPRMGRVVPEFEISHVRELILQNYRIVYRVEVNGDIGVVAVIRGSMDMRSRVGPRLWDLT